MYRQARFYAEWLDANGLQNFWGWTDGSLWNGFECPHFEKDTAMRVLAAHNGETEHSYYDREADCFVFYLEEAEDLERYHGHAIHTESGDTRHVYAIGAYSWIWSLWEPMVPPVGHKALLARAIEDLFQAEYSLAIAIGCTELIGSRSDAGYRVSGRLAHDNDETGQAFQINMQVAAWPTSRTVVVGEQAERT